MAFILFQRFLRHTNYSTSKKIYTTVTLFPGNSRITRQADLVAETNARAKSPPQRIVREPMHVNTRRRLAAQAVRPLL